MFIGLLPICRTGTVGEKQRNIQVDESDVIYNVVGAWA